MNIGPTIIKIRNNYHLTQEKFAEMLHVSRQAVQKWEAGIANPDLNHVIAISKMFHISLDALVLGSDIRIWEELAIDKKIQPRYACMHPWELYSSDLLTEYRQSQEEGKNVAAYEQIFIAVSQLPANTYKEQISDVLFHMAAEAEQIPDYGYIEPSDLDRIHQLCRPLTETAANTKQIRTIPREKIEGAWVGRICGCLLGKPIEGIRTNELIPLLKTSNNYPMHRYIESGDITDELCAAFQFRLQGKCYADTISCAPADDDTNYTVLAAQLVEKCGRNFTSSDVGGIWLESQPKSAYCTAERVAYKNITNGYLPPASALYKNPYREWIGAQIRGDYYGYINPGNPQAAADMAWRDASISHVKNGIYGEMFVAAMIACAAVSDDLETILLTGLSCIPATSRLYGVVSQILENYRDHRSEAECFKGIHARFNEFDQHDWCHTISNAAIVAASLLYGEGDYTRSICRAVQTGFDTDCNGATVGSIIGMRNGIGGIDRKWYEPLKGELDTTIFGTGRIRISDLVDLTIKHLNNMF